MTTVTPAITPTTTVSTRATAGAVGGALWVLLPLAWSVAQLDDQPFGSLSFVAVAIADWLFLVAAPALIVVGHTALRSALGPAAGRVARIGIVVAALGLGAMAVGNGIEVASMTIGGGEVALGHGIFLIGFLVSVIGGVLLGIALVRSRRAVMIRVAGWILLLALPLGMGIGFLGSLVAPESDAGFWAAISVPTGAAWVLLGRSLTAHVPSSPNR